MRKSLVDSWKVSSSDDFISIVAVVMNFFDVVCDYGSIFQVMDVVYHQRFSNFFIFKTNIIF